MSTDNQQDNQDFDSRADNLWSIYIKEADKHDRALMVTWKDDMDTLIIFVRLHSTGTNPDLFSSCFNFVGWSLFCRFNRLPCWSNQESQARSYRADECIIEPDRGSPRPNLTTTRSQWLSDYHTTTPAIGSVYVESFRPQGQHFLVHESRFQHHRCIWSNICAAMGPRLSATF